MIAPWYAMYYVKLDRIAWRHGYCLALHGSMARDFDLVAIPWLDSADDPEMLVEAFRKFVISGADINLKIAPPAIRPHGRLSYVIPIGHGDQYLDLSVMPKKFDVCCVPSEELRMI